MRGWPVPRPTHAPATAFKTNNNSAPQNKKSKPLVPSSPEHVKESPPIVIPEFSGAALAVTENIRNLPRQRAGAPPPPQLLSVRPNNAHHQPKLLVQPLPRRHACLAGPPANTCSRNSHQNKPQKNPPSKFQENSSHAIPWRHACLTAPVVKRLFPHTALFPCAPPTPEICRIWANWRTLLNLDIPPPDCGECATIRPIHFS